MDNLDVDEYEEFVKIVEALNKRDNEAMKKAASGGK